MSPPVGCWADLPPELLGSIGENILDLKYYASARGACKAWRSALVPPFPSLLVVPDDAGCSPSAASIPTPHRAFELKAIPSGAQCVGASSGWLALSNSITAPGISDGPSMLSLFNPITGTEIDLPPLILLDCTMRVSKIVLAPNPVIDDFAVAAICGKDMLAYVTAGARRWAILDPVNLTPGDHLTDLVYHEQQGSVYCLTGYGDVHVLLLPERRRRAPIMDDDNEDEAPILEAPIYPYEPSALPRLVPIVHHWLLFVPPEMDSRRRAQCDEIDRRRRAQQLCSMIHKRSSGPDLNAPAKVEPLLSLPFNPATSFSLQYNKFSGFTSAKNLVFVKGDLYQIWRNASCTMTVQLPGGGGRRRIAENEVFVLRYYPDHQPCWDAVTDLGGYSVFVGRNNAVSMYAQDVPGLKGNCVYSIGGRGRGQGMVFDMTTRTCTPCLHAAAAGVAPQSTVCWYFLSGMMDNCNIFNGGKRVLSDLSESSS